MRQGLKKHTTELGTEVDHILEMSFNLQHILTCLFHKILPN